MNEELKKTKTDPKVIAYIASGAIIGGITGYFMQKIGFKNLTKWLKEKDIISPNLSKLLEEFDFKTCKLSKSADSSEEKSNEG